jgi:carbon storage regulator
LDKKLFSNTTRKERLGMLVLSRNKNESVIIGDDIEITIVDIRRNKVRLGINAPKKVPVHRREVYEIIQHQQAKKNDSKPLKLAQTP